MRTLALVAILVGGACGRSDVHPLPPGTQSQPLFDGCPQLCEQMREQLVHDFDFFDSQIHCWDDAFVAASSFSACDHVFGCKFGGHVIGPYIEPVTSPTPDCH
jgi:hypothetical protein